MAALGGGHDTAGVYWGTSTSRSRHALATADGVSVLTRAFTGAIKS